MTVREDRRPRSSLRRFFATWAALSLLSALWALATPLSASPDEPSHVVKAASVVRGEFIGEASLEGNLVHVPKYIAWTNALTCFAYDPTQSAACSPGVPGEQAETMEIGTRAGLYNPVYYLLTGWPSLLFDSMAGVYAMRLVSALIASAALASAFALVAAWRRPAIPTIGLVVITTPMLLFLTGSFNPNALETTATLAAFVGMLSIALEPNPALLRVRATVVAVASVLAVTSRGLSPIWVAIALLLPLALLTGRAFIRTFTRPAVIGAVVTVIAATVFAGLWLLGTNSLGAAVSDPDAENIFPGAGTPFAIGFRQMVTDTFAYASQLIGLFGWLDTAAQPLVLFIWTALFGAILLLGLAAARGRELIVVLVAIAAFVLLPPLVQAAYVTDGGYIWQGRYNFALFAMMIFACTAMIGQREWTIDAAVSNRLALILIAAMGVGHAATFMWVLLRYAVGTDAGIGAFLTAPEWSAPGGNVLLLVLFAISAAAVSALAYRTVRVSRTTATGLAVVREDSLRSHEGSDRR